MALNRYTIFIPAVIFTAGILFSCSNSLDSIAKIAENPNAPDEEMNDLNLIYTDSGHVQVKIYANTSESFHKPKDITYLKKGLRVDFYTKTGEITSILTAINGVINHKTGKVHVSDSVRLINIEKERILETEDLHWNQKDSTIFTKKHVVIRSKDNGIQGEGEGLSTTQSFDTYKIDKPSGSFTLEI